MAVSPGPASSVLRFLRGGCGGGCLCGRLCEPCRRGDDCQPTEATVERVLPDRVVLTDGRAFPRPGGASPRPGQTIIVDCRPGLIALTPHAPPHLEQTTEGVFVPQVSSYDSPQRPGLWLAGHFPVSTPEGVFEGDGGSGAVNVMVLDDGSTVEPGGATVVDLMERTVSWVSYQRLGTPLVGGYLPFPVDIQLISSDGAFYWKQYAKRGVPYGSALLPTSGDLEIITQPFDPAQPVAVVVEAFSVVVEIPYIKLIGDYTNHVGYRGFNGVLYAQYKLQSGEEGEYPITQPSYTYPATGESTYLLDMKSATSQSQDMPNTPFSWRSPDGAVVVAAGWRTDHALLGGQNMSTLDLLAYGVALSGGSWAALCGPVVDGVPEPWVVHEAGDTITRVTPDGEVAQMTRAAFEVEVLRVPTGRFQRFSAAGTLDHSWPPHWAFCECGQNDLEEVRALILHAPWRDSVPQVPPPDAVLPLPEWWFWPARPRRRPPERSVDAPVAPLGLALADVFTVFRETGGPT